MRQIGGKIDHYALNPKEKAGKDRPVVGRPRLLRRTTSSQELMKCRTGIIIEKNITAKEGINLTSTFLHVNFNVLDLDRSLEFYERALGLTELRRKEAPDGSFIIVFLSDGRSPYLLELTWLRDRKEPYNLGDNEIHLAVRVENKREAYQLHQNMGCICYENKDMDLYFIADPDGYWIEILDR